MARQIKRRCSRAGFSVNVVCAPSVPLSFEVSVSGKVVHSKLNGQGFISTKEKLSSCMKKILKILRAPAPEQGNLTLPEDSGTSLFTAL